MASIDDEVGMERGDLKVALAMAFEAERIYEKTRRLIGQARLGG